MRPTHLIAITLALAGLIACAAGLPMVTVLDAQVAGVPLDELRGGRDVYVAKCSGCHRLYSPAEYDDAAWDAHVHGMSEKARLKDGDIAAILAYVTAMNGDRSLEVAQHWASASNPSESRGAATQ